MIHLPVFDPEMLRIGPVAVRWYGFMYALGFAAAWILGRVQARRPWSRFREQEVDDLISWLILGLVAGGRLGYVVFYDLRQYLAHPLEIFFVWKGGMSFHGGLLGVLAVAWRHARRTGKSFWEVTDFLAPLTPLGLFFGRIGNFINGELVGRPTSLPWGVVYPQPEAGGVPRHHSQLYEAGLEGLALFMILWVFARKPRQAGAVSGLFLTGYGLFRILGECFREPDAHLGFILFGAVTMGQLLSLPMVALGLWLLRRSERQVG